MVRAEALQGLVQPDGFTCGAAVVVAVRALDDPAYAARLRDPATWRAEVLTTHREVRRLVDPVAARAAAPWPRRLGTPPWAVARRLSATTGRRWRSVVVWPWRRREARAALRRALDAGIAVPLVVGSRLLPRHVVLVLHAVAGAFEVWDPARGAVVVVPGAAFTAAHLRLGRWQVPWVLVLPEAALSPRGAGRRTPA